MKLIGKSPTWVMPIISMHIYPLAAPNAMLGSVPPSTERLYNSIFLDPVTGPHHDSMYGGQDEAESIAC